MDARQGGVPGAYNKSQGEMGDRAGKRGNELEHAKHLGHIVRAQ